MKKKSNIILSSRLIVFFLCVTLLLCSDIAVAQRNKKIEKKIGFGLSLQGVTNFYSKLHYRYVNPLIDIVYKKEKNIASLGLLIPISRIDGYKYWFSLNYLKIGKEWKNNWSFLYGVNIDFSRVLYHYYIDPNIVGPFVYFKKYNCEIIAQTGLVYKLSKKSFITLNLGAGINVAFKNENSPPTGIKSGAIIYPCIKFRININKLFY